MISGAVFVVLFLWISAAGTRFLTPVVYGAITYILGVMIADIIIKMGWL